MIILIVATQTKIFRQDKTIYGSNLLYFLSRIMVINPMIPEIYMTYRKDKNPTANFLMSFCLHGKYTIKF
jgi:hypothetical protein